MARRAALLESDGADRTLVSFVFELAREGQECKTIDPALASGLAGLLLANTAHGTSLATFLVEQTSYRGINRDQWMGVWEFAQSVDKAFSNYNEDGAWPCLLDEFVEYERAKQEEGAENPKDDA